jgi:DNA-binding MarR family transcriptional regulator
VQDLESRGLVAKRTSTADGRSNLARLTAPGMAKMKSAWPTHLASVRKRWFDHIDDSDVQRTGLVLSAVAAQLED